MKNETLARVVINSERKRRGLISIAERKNGDLQLDIRARQQMRELGTLIDAPAVDLRHGVAITEYRYSIHMSPNSESNVIKLTQKLEIGDLNEIFHFTSAIKKDQAFTPIYARRCSGLLDPTYDVKNDDAVILNLGDTSPPFTLIFGVFVGPSGRQFKLNNLKDINVAQLEFSNFNLVVLWSFLTAPAHDSGMFSHFATLSDLGPSQGCSEEKCVELFKYVRENLRKEYVMVLEKVGLPNAVMNVARASTFSRKANLKSTEMLTHGINLRLKGIII